MSLQLRERFSSSLCPYSTVSSAFLPMRAKFHVIHDLDENQNRLLSLTATVTVIVGGTPTMIPRRLMIGAMIQAGIAGTTIRADEMVAGVGMMMGRVRDEGNCNGNSGGDDSWGADTGGAGRGGGGGAW